LERREEEWREISRIGREGDKEDVPAHLFGMSTACESRPMPKEAGILFKVRLATMSYIGLIIGEERKKP